MGTTTILRFENGVVGVLDINWLTPTKVRALRLTGEHGMFLVDYLHQDLYWCENGESPGALRLAQLLLDSARAGRLLRAGGGSAARGP
jgi:hypothetical protein